MVTASSNSTQRTSIATGDTSFREALRAGVSVGTWLEQQRFALGLNQKELATALQEDRSAISRLESGRAGSAGLAQSLASYFYIAPSDKADFLLWIRGRIAVTANPVAPIRHNLPNQLTPLIGREPLLAAAATLVQRTDRRLLTLTGPGGIGKTRFALQLGTALVDDFTDGVWFVGLDSVRDPKWVVITIAETLGIKEVAGQPHSDTLKQYLRDKQLLLILDNFEQVLSAAPLLSELLRGAVDIKMLITSRTVLHLYGEVEYQVPPLTVPNLEFLPGMPQLAEYEAIQLFVERARAIQPDFMLNEENSQVVARICARLDGLPLAIELAASRLRVLTLTTLYTRLEKRLQILKGGAQDMPDRQQTLRGAIGWSYELLNPEQQQMFRRLAMFEGGCTLEAIEDICTTNGNFDTTISELSALIDSNLVRKIIEPSGEARFVMLETIREYALERFEASNEVDTLRNRYAQYFLTLTENPQLDDFGAVDPRWLTSLAREHSNFHSVLNWANRQQEAEIALRLSIALWTSGIGTALGAALTLSAS